MKDSSEEADSLNVYHVWSDVFLKLIPLLLRGNKLKYSSVKEHGVCNLFSNTLAKQGFMSICASTYVYGKILAMSESGWRVQGWSSNLSGRTSIDVIFFFFKWNREAKYISTKRNLHLLQLSAVHCSCSKPELVSFQVSDLEGRCQLAGD